MKYEFRENKNEERSFELKENSLYYESTKTGTEEIPYGEIQKVILLSPVKKAYVCQIIYGRKKRIAFPNRSFISFDKFDYKNDEYISFLEELHSRLKSNPGVEFSAGSSFLYYFMLITLPLVLLVPVITIIFASEGYRMPISPFIGLLIVIPLAIHYLRKGKKIFYQPDKLPEKYIPVSVILFR